ncbi:MAG TPA: PLP-dependent aminotransferase family protein [Vicinamibacteria bacterium]|nr:PLP-dependent aminotransferase family protein [Vicinamibacteria bacterium]
MTALLDEPRARDAVWTDRFAQRTGRATSSVIREFLKLLDDPDIISFAGGLPAPEVFPADEILAASHRVLRQQRDQALQYGATEGYRPLRELLVRHMARYGIEVGPENVLVTSGAQQALDLVGKAFINPGDRIAMEDPTYLGAIQAFSAYEAHYVTVPLDDDGMCVDRLEDALRAAPKFVYVLPNFQNPSGVTLSLARRRRLVEICARYGTPIVEDDPYGQLRYEGDHLPPLVTLDADLHGCARGERSFRGSVIYLGTLSKTLAPGLRIGWVVASAEVVSKLAVLKQGADLHSSSFAQMVAYETAQGGFLDRHVKLIRQVYAERRDAMLSALQRHMPAGVRWTHPQGGLFLYLTLPPGVLAADVLKDALAAKVACIPGTAFHPVGGGERSMRLNFSYSRPEVIEEGIARLGAVLRRHVSPARAPQAPPAAVSAG